MQGEGFAEAESDQTRRSGRFLSSNVADLDQNSPLCSGTDQEDISVFNLEFAIVALNS